MSAMTAEGQTRPERGTSGHSVSTVARRELTKRPPWGGGVRTGSVSAETRAEVCTPPAGCGQQSRDGMCYPRSMRNDWNSAKKFTQPEWACKYSKSNSPETHHVVLDYMRERRCDPLSRRSVLDEYPGTPGIWERWHAPVQLRRLPHSCGREVARKEKPGLNLGFPLLLLPWEGCAVVVDPSRLYSEYPKA